MDVFTALQDHPDSRPSTHIGVFSTEAKARQACQDDYDADNEVSGQPETPLTWRGPIGAFTETKPLPDGDVYDVIMTTLDIPTGQG